MPGHDIIVVGASAGGVEALITLTRGLPSKLSAAIFIVIHIPAQSPSLLPDILKHVGSLEVVRPVDGTAIEHGHIYVAQPDHHLLVERDKVRVIRGPKENRHRPAVDPLFRSAAEAYGPRVVGVVLTGSLDDGTAGLLAVKRRDGVAVVQDPNEALYPSMPASALAHVKVDHVLSLASIGPLLTRLASEEVKAEQDNLVSKDPDAKTRLTEMDTAMMQNQGHIGTPSAFSCPECGGVLWELEDEGLLHFRCRVGHAFSLESVLAEQAGALESALWAALKTLQESAELLGRIARQAHSRNRQSMAKHFEEKLQDVEQRVALIKGVLMDDKTFVKQEAEKL